MAGIYWPEIAGDYSRSSGQDLALTDQATFLNVIYSYFVSHPSELSHEARKNIDDYLAGRLDKEASDDRPIEVQAADLMGDWDAFDKDVAARSPTKAE